MPKKFFTSFERNLIFAFFFMFLPVLIFAFDGRTAIVASGAAHFRALRNGLVEKKEIAFRTIRDANFRKNESLSIEDFFAQEMKEILGDDFLEDDNEFFDASSILELLDNKDSKGIEDETAEISGLSFADNFGELRRFTFDGEQSTARKGKNGEIEIVSVYKTKIKRRKFDSRFRPISTEIFTLSGNSKSLKVFSKRDFQYADEFSLTPKKSTEQRDSSRIETTFGKTGLPEIIAEFSIDKDGKKTPTKKRVRAYDDSGRTIVDERTQWQNDEKLFVRYVYTFTEICEEPDEKFYEDGILRLEKKHTAEKNWTEQTFFDNGFSVITEFSDGVKKSEAVMFGDLEIRRRVFNETKKSNPREFSTDDKNVHIPLKPLKNEQIYR